MICSIFHGVGKYTPLPARFLFVRRAHRRCTLGVLTKQSPEQWPKGHAKSGAWFWLHMRGIERWIYATFFSIILSAGRWTRQKSE